MHDILQTLSSKRPNSEIFKLNVENWSEGQFEELTASQGLFEKKYIVVLDFILGAKDKRDFVLDKIKEMSESEHWFLILDGKLDATVVKKVEKVAYKSQNFEKTEVKKDNPIIFTITDKLLTRDKKKLWITFVDLINKDIPAEEIHGLLFWAVKNMILASRSKNQKDSGLAPFQYNKSLAGAKKYTEEELQKMSSDLVEMVHLVRSGEGEMEIMLEKWVLGI